MQVIFAEYNFPKSLIKSNPIVHIFSNRPKPTNSRVPNESFSDIGYSSVRYKIEKSKYVTETTRRRWKTIKQTAGVCSDDAKLIILGAHWFIRGLFGDGERGREGAGDDQREKDLRVVFEILILSYTTQSGGGRWCATR